MKSYPIIATFNFFLAMSSLRCSEVVGEWERRMLCRVGLAAAPLDRDTLTLQHFVLERVHASCRLVDLAREGDRPGQDGLELFLVLDARLRVLVLDHQVGVRHVE